MTFDDAIQVLQAAKAGKKIQCRIMRSLTHGWTDMPIESATPEQFQFDAYEYRVKPEPRCFVMYLMDDNCGAIFTSSTKGLENSRCVGSALLVEGVFHDRRHQGQPEQRDDRR